MAISKEQIERINALAKKKKSPEGLTPAELEEQSKLRRIYIDSFKENLRGQLMTTKFVDEKGNDVTPPSLKREQKKNGLR